MIKDISRRTYAIDTTKCDYVKFQKLGIKNLKLILKENGEYEFFPKYSILEGYDGKWDISNDAELSNYVFDCKNGTYEVTDLLNINFTYKGKNYTFCFQ